MEPIVLGLFLWVDSLDLICVNLLNPCPVEFPTSRAYSSGVAPADGTGVKCLPRLSERSVDPAIGAQ